MKPTEEELLLALELAEDMHERDHDSQHIAQTLLYLHQRNQELEKILEHVDRFLRFGMPTEEHAKLVNLVNKIREQEREESGEDIGQMGL
ncbi:MAG: hypothetical protein GY696_16795 [Gammaproteobacteria bacterium]|nr:hypothetical protein [Gammaproteobacteria bacterium]